MKRIEGFFGEIGTFESYSGDMIFINDNLLLPMFNVQLGDNHPLTRMNENWMLDYCFFFFQGVSSSSRHIHPANRDELIYQVNYLNTTANVKENYINFLIETRDFRNAQYVYWNWVVKAKKFDLLVHDDYQLGGGLWNDRHFDSYKFLQIDLEYIIKLLPLE